jgi:methyltransferase (TIGR00027 family)
MDSNTPSRTAHLVAAHRAAHQVIDQGAIFMDPLALPILGVDAEQVTRDAATHPGGALLRLFIAIRTRVAEDALAKAVHSGVSQLVILGAGLETYAYRNPFPDRLRVFEVDHPATQAWKRSRLTEARIAPPPGLTFVEMDLEHQALGDRLGAKGFDQSRRSFCFWLGVVSYLTRSATLDTLRFIANLAGEAHVVFDYADPPESLAPEDRRDHEKLAVQVARVGEEFVSYYDAAELAAQLAELGFSELSDLGPIDLRRRYLPSLSGPKQTRGGHVMHARTVRR